MIASLTGTVEKLTGHALCIHVGGVGYAVSAPMTTLEKVFDGQTATLKIHTHVKEDRLDLFGFLTEEDRSLFRELIALDGIGPKIAMEICSIAKRDLHTSVTLSDTRTIENVKGIGKKKAQKLLVDLQALYEKHPEWMGSIEQSDPHSLHDEDALAALIQLGYERTIIVKALKNLPKNLTKTEERVTAVLRSM